MKKRLVNPAKYSSASACPMPNARHSRSSPTCITGSPPRQSSRSSQATRAAAAGTARPSSSQLHPGQPDTRPSTSGTRISSSTAASRRLPARSSRCSSGSWRDGSSRNATASATIPMNRFTRKTQRQPSVTPASCTRTPPSSGPAAVETPTIPPR
ncbi:MAG: hypothetical protein WAL12_11540 [Trebonia sp.]